MTKEIRDNHVILTASEGYFLSDGHIYGISVSLGLDADESAFEELPIEQMPVVEEPELNIEEPVTEEREEPTEPEPDEGLLAAAPIFSNPADPCYQPVFEAPIDNEI